MWGRADALMAVGVTLAALAACNGELRQTSPIWMMCKNDASDNAALQQKVAACSALIKGGLKTDDLVQALKARSDAYRSLSQYDPAVADDTQAMRLDPQDSAAAADRGLARYDQGRSDLATVDFNQALRLDPDNAAALNGRAYVERQDGDDDAAIRDDGRAIELKPEWADPWASRGLAFLDKGWFDMALADFRDALRLDHALTDVLDSVAEAENGKGDPARAMRAYLQAANVDLEEKNFDDAIDQSGKAAKLAPDDPDALNAGCWARAVAKDDLDQAETDCQRSLSIRPGSAEVIDSLAFVRFREGRMQEALAGFNEALAKNPKQAESLYMRGIVKLRLGDQDGGAADLQTAQSQDRSVGPRYANWGVAADNSAQ